MEGNIFNIQRYSTHDGPGIRTTVFLKGCPLRCFWCQNPESQPIEPVLLLNREHCTGCGRCVDQCPQGAISMDAEHRSTVDREACRVCGKCAAKCLNRARSVSGKVYTLENVMEIILKDANIYRNSGGGVTVSGGDPVLQHEFAYSLLNACKQQCIHTAIETSGYCGESIFKKLLSVTDYVFFDLKCMDPQLHIQGTGVSNMPILNNARILAHSGREVRFRTPLIPGYNDTDENILATRRFITDELGLSPDCAELLRYNPYGEDKYDRLGRSDRPRFTAQSEERFAQLQQLLYYGSC